MRNEQHNLDGRGTRQCRVYDMEPAAVDAHHWMGPGRPVEVRAVPDYWAAVTDVPCPCDGCGGTIRWHEAGYVPGYRICDTCLQHFLAKGDVEAPTLVRVGDRRG